MRQGLAFKIRFNPEDIMTAIDIVKGAGLFMEGMSLASVVRLAASSAFEQLRQNGAVPKRDGFEYEAMVRPYLGGALARKQIVSQALSARERDSQAMDRSPVPGHALRRALPQNDPSRERLQRELDELVSKKQADPLNFDAQERLDELFDLLHGAP